MYSFAFYHIILVIVFVITLVGLLVSLLNVNAVITGLYAICDKTKQEDAHSIIHSYMKSIVFMFINLVVLIISIFLLFNH